MRLEWQIAPPASWRAGAVLFFLFEGSPVHLPGLDRWLDGEGRWLSGSAGLQDFRGKPNEIGIFYAPEADRGIPRVILAGLGRAEQFDPDRLRNAAAHALRKCRDLRISSPGLPLWALEGLPGAAAGLLQESLVGGITGLHQFQELKTRENELPQEPESLQVIAEHEPGEELRAVPALAESIAAGVTMARDLVVSPGNRATPGFLADTARGLADRYGFKVDIIDFDSAEAMGMGAFAAVARGSREPAYVVVIESAPEGLEQDAPLVFIGKGITFDTGGISLKGRDKLDVMKQDMAGAAAVLGAFEALGRAGVRRRVTGILPCTENMPDGRAYKPGDVIRTLSGQTVEVISTDAEGRMVLCDALSYAQRFAPAAIVDIATLTGAAIIALGNQAAAVLGNREDFIRKVQETGARVGERFWQLPLWDSYFDALKSEVADMKNVGDRSAGTIVGAIFLKQFVAEEIPWVHLDIAGTAWSDKDTGAVQKGATGFGVRTLFELARTWPELGIG
jgi:leucyl aminopeptidase